MTNEQKQCLLRYLGYYTGDVDGIWGKGSKEATTDFQENNDLKADGIFGSATKTKIIEHISKGTGFKKTETKPNGKPGDFWADIKYFNKNEFACKCDGKYCKGYPVEMQEKVIRVLDRVRGNLGKPATVTSGIRCTRHNANVGGVSNSRHLSGKAVDFCIPGVSQSKLLAEVQKDPNVRYAYAIKNSNAVHVDVA